MIEPSLHDVGLIPTQQADEARQPARINHSAADAERLDRYTGGRDDRTDRTGIRHADDHRAESASVGSRDEPREHALGAPCFKPGYQVQDGDHQSPVVIAMLSRFRAGTVRH